MLATKVFSLGPDNEHITNAIVHFVSPAPPAPSIPWPNSKPAGVTVELAIDHCPPRRSFGEKTVAEMAEARRTMPRARENAHVAQQLERPEHDRVAINTRALTSGHPKERRRIPHARLIEQTTLNQSSTCDFIAGNHRARGVRIGKASLECDRSGYQPPGMNAGIVLDVRSGVDKSQRPRLGLIVNMAATVCVAH